jgi:cytidylate kinase
MAIPVITIDGPSGTGKGTLANSLAAALGWHFLDSGALYRIVAVGAEARNIPRDDLDRLTAFARSMEVSFSTYFPGSIVLEGQEISDLVRLEESGNKASLVAVIPEVRAALLERQRAFRRQPGLVADGRDMGTVVFPDAPLKFFLTASAEVRAERRYKQLINKGVSVNLRGLLLDIQARDERDSTRAVAPLQPADDAIIMDTDSLNAAEVLAEASARIRAKLGLDISLR